MNFRGFRLWAFLLFTLPLAGSAALIREPNSTLALPQNLPVQGFATTNAFTNIFSAPVALVTPFGETNQLFIVEQTGRILVITNLNSPTVTIFMNIASRTVTGGEQGLLGLAFHPDYASNGYFYVFYTGTGTSPIMDRLSRFSRSTTNPFAGNSASELILINQADEASNHNGGDIHFGPDGYLYVSLGDEGGGNDQYANSQRIDKDYFAGILRIDVDKRPGNLPANPHPAASTNYLVPADNPFVGATRFNGLTVNSNLVRTEFWAVGLRNPWRMSFDRVTGDLYVGDVGQGARDEIDIITRGGNYGWSYREGLIAGPRASPPAGFTHINPIQDYPQPGAPGANATNSGRSVTGGLVYRGSRFASISNFYIFGDYSSGNIWALRYQGTNTIPYRHLATDIGVAAFGIDPRNGDILLANVNQGRVKRLIYSTNITGAPIPPTLSQVGAYSNLVSLTPHAGIVPFDINVPFWSDGARKTRWFSVPNTNLDITFHPEGNWQFPTGTVWVKHFDIELTNGVAASNRRLETRFLVKNVSGIYGVTYRWDNSQTNATLVPEEGLDEALAINDGGIMRTQVWHYPSRSECLTCHPGVAGFAVGFNTPQLNLDYNYGDTNENQISALTRAGYFQNPPTNIHTLRRLAAATNDAWSLEHRVRSYLAANCIQCHQPGGAALGNFDTRITTPTSRANLIDGPLVNAMGDTNNRVVVRNSLTNSMLLTRISTLGTGRMPPLDSRVLDTNGIALLSAWITNELPAYRHFSEWQQTHFGGSTNVDAQPAADPDGDGSENEEEFLLKTDPNSAASIWKLEAARGSNGMEVVYSHLARIGFDLQWTTNLFQSNQWQSLNDPQNKPFHSRSNFNGVIRQEATNSPPTYYRMRIYEP